MLLLLQQGTVAPTAGWQARNPLPLFVVALQNHMAAGQPVVAMLDPPGLLPAHTAAMMPAQTTAMPEQTTAMSSVYPVMVQYNGQVMQPNLQLVQPNLQMMQPHTQTVVQSPSTIFFAGALTGHSSWVLVGKAVDCSDVSWYARTHNPITRRFRNQWGMQCGRRFVG